MPRSVILLAKFRQSDLLAVRAHRRPARRGGGIVFEEDAVLFGRVIEGDQIRWVVKTKPLESGSSRHRRHTPG